MREQEPIFVLDIMRDIHAELLSLLTDLRPEDWLKQTIAGSWRVKDIAAHLLDGQIRSLSMLRDGFYGDKPGELESYAALLTYLNRLNADWVRAMRRISPGIITELLEMTGEKYIDFLAGLDPFAPATFAVAWAGEESSANWFHIAREYTEQWHHQQQIRLAVGREEVLYQQQFYYPYLNISMQALPHHYRNVPGNSGDTIHFTVVGVRSGDWYLRFTEGRWRLADGYDRESLCRVSIPGTIAWRIFTKGVDREEAMALSEVRGRSELGKPIFQMLAVMA